MAASRAATEIALRRSRMEAEVYAERAEKEEALKRSRVEANVSQEVAAERRARLERELREENNSR